MSSGEFSRVQKGLSAAAMALLLSSCTSGNQTRPGPAPTSAEASVTTPSKAELDWAESTLGTAADAAASQIIQNANDPKSHCKNTSNTLISNGEWIASGSPKAVPQLTLSYDPARREVALVYLFDAGPNSSTDAIAFGGSVQAFFDAGPDSNVIDRKLAPTPHHPNGQPMTTADVFSVISSKQALLTSVEVSDEISGVTETAFFNPDNTVSYAYQKGDKGAGPFVVDQANANKLMNMADNVSNRIDRMDKAFGYK